MEELSERKPLVMKRTIVFRIKFSDVKKKSAEYFWSDYMSTARMYLIFINLGSQLEKKLGR